jgi:ketosteroid isomerase-like protein
MVCSEDRSRPAGILDQFHHGARVALWNVILSATSRRFYPRWHAKTQTCGANRSGRPFPVQQWFLEAALLGQSLSMLRHGPDGRSPFRRLLNLHNKSYRRAWKEKDYVSLNRLLSDDYRAVNFKGIVSTKANEIATAKEDRDYETLNGDVMSVNLFADCAIASGLIEARRKDEQGTMQHVTLRFLEMLQRQKGEWKLVATQSTRFDRPNSQ